MDLDYYWANKRIQCQGKPLERKQVWEEPDTKWKPCSSIGIIKIYSFTIVYVIFKTVLNVLKRWRVWACPYYMIRNFRWYVFECAGCTLLIVDTWQSHPYLLFEHPTPDSVPACYYNNPNHYAKVFHYILDSLRSDTMRPKPFSVVKVRTQVFP